MEEKKLKILFISSWYPSKYRPLHGIFVKRHAAANTLDCHVSAVFICSGESHLIEELVEDGIYTIRGYYKQPNLKLTPFFGIMRFIRYFMLWRKVLMLYKKKKGKPDLVNANIVYPVSIMAIWLKIFWKVPYIITEHWTGYFPEDGKYKGFIMKIISKIAVANAAAVITDSSKLSSTMISLGLVTRRGGLRNSYFTIPNVVDPEQFKCKSTQAGSHLSLSFNFIHISSLDNDQKNVAGIIHTFKEFHASNPLSKLTIVWNEESIEMLDSLRKKEPFSENEGIFIQGMTMSEVLAATIQKSDALILFSNYENLPCVMLESFCCGVPVIATRVGDVPEYINEKNGILIDPKNEVQLLEAMETIFKNREAYNAAEIRSMVVDKISPAVISKQLVDIYKMVLLLSVFYCISFNPLKIGNSKAQCSTSNTASNRW